MRTSPTLASRGLTLKCIHAFHLMQDGTKIKTRGGGEPNEGRALVGGVQSGCQGPRRAIFSLPANSGGSVSAEGRRASACLQYSSSGGQTGRDASTSSSYVRVIRVRVQESVALLRCALVVCGLVRSSHAWRKSQSSPGKSILLWNNYCATLI